jgi:NAD(P)-dependent dehydrogenase (short-subunit alcohol dehydrogenase family)
MSVADHMNDYYDHYLPLRYVPPPKECAGGIIFLVSDMARVITGQALSINGGEWFGA